MENAAIIEVGDGELAETAKKEAARRQRTNPEAEDDIPPIVIVSGEALMERYPDPVEPLVHGVLGRGEKLMLAAPSKVGKTWSLLGLAAAITNGEEWFGHRCERGRVLFLNYEITEHRMAARLRALRDAGVDLSRVEFVTLVGDRRPWKTLLDAIAEETEGDPLALAVVDPMYKLLGDTNENDNTEVTAMLHQAGEVCARTGAALAYAHHHSKGDKSRTTPLDRASGAGAFARDADAIVNLTPHEEEGCYVFEVSPRHYQRPEPSVWRFEWPTFMEEPELDAAKLKGSPAGAKKKGSPEDVVAVIAEQGAKPSGALDRAVKERFGYSERTARTRRDEAESAGLIVNLSGQWSLTDKGRAVSAEAA